ncbi:MAG: ankyrin repeat domain-containing protein [Candidatus Pacebacteria bacterium]|nr:ankyrin repeat domain-containing protein [Candidatus Paceibacterota bacterium]
MTQSTPELEARLIASVISENSSEIKHLISSGVNINARDSLGFSALMWAVTRNDVALAQLLINNRADVNAKTDYGYTILMNASQLGYFEMVKLLISAGANPIDKCDEGKTALNYAEESQKAKKVAEFLKNNGKRKSSWW